MLVAACYTYVPVTTTSPPAASEIRVELNSGGTSAVTSRFGPNVVAFDGRLSSTGADGALVIQATALQKSNGAHEELVAEDTVTVPRTYVAGLEVRTLNRRNTTVAAVAIAAALATAGIVALRGARADAPANEPGPGPLTTRAPAWMRIR